MITTKKKEEINIILQHLIGKPVNVYQIYGMLHWSVYGILTISDIEGVPERYCVRINNNINTWVYFETEMVEIIKTDGGGFSDIGIGPV